MRSQEGGISEALVSSKDWREIATIVWAAASQNSRHKKSSTVGYMAGYTPCTILEWSEQSVALVSWCSTKAPPENLGSNGSEVHAIVVFLLRAFWYEIHGGKVCRGCFENDLADCTTDGLMMDSRAVYDAMSRNLSPLHGLAMLTSRVGADD